MVDCSSTLFLQVRSTMARKLSWFSWPHYSGYPEPGKTTVYDSTEIIDLETIDLNGGFLIKILELSIDPYMRGKMRAPTVKSFLVSDGLQWVERWILNSCPSIASICAWRTVSSKLSDLDRAFLSLYFGFAVWKIMELAWSFVQSFQVSNRGTIFMEIYVSVCQCLFYRKNLIRSVPLEAFQNYVIKNDLNSLRVFENPYKLPWSTFIGVLGMPGKCSG